MDISIGSDIASCLGSIRTVYPARPLAGRLTHVVDEVVEGHILLRLVAGPGVRGQLDHLGDQVGELHQLDSSGSTDSLFCFSMCNAMSGMST